MPEPKQAQDPDSPKAARSFSVRAERSLKESDRLLRERPGGTQQQAMAQFEQAKVFALLQLAEAIRQNRKR